MAFTEDLAGYLVDFGEAVVVNGAALTALFDEPSAENFGEVAGRRPVLTCRDSDLSGVMVGAPATVRSAAYTVVNLIADGTGITRLVLERAA